MCCALLLIPVAVALGGAALLLATPGSLAPAAAGVGWAGLLLSVSALAATLGLALLWALATADADVSLLLRGRHAPDAFRGKVVWLTGASQGLGEVLARYLASQGARLILSSRSADKLQRVKAACHMDASNVLLLPFDLLDAPEALQAAAAAADAAFGGAGVDFLVHNAGASQHALAAETSAEVAHALLRINSLAPICLTQAALPFLLRRRKGRLVVIASMAAKLPSPGQAVYSGAKMAVWGYFASLATEVADQGVAVTLVCPGPIATGSPEAPRCIYGSKGLVQRQEVPDSKRMAPARAALLIANAMAAGVPEAWLAKQPVLTMAYIMQYAPQLGWAIMCRLGPRRARALAAGRSGYDISAMLR